MRALTPAQRTGYRRAAAVLAVLAAATLLTGIWVGLEWPLGWYYGGLGMLMGVLAAAIAFAVVLVANKAPSA